jgi:hypothetical protein
MPILTCYPVYPVIMEILIQTIILPKPFPLSKFQAIFDPA